MKKGLGNFILFLVVASLYIVAIFKVADEMDKYAIKRATFAFRSGEE